jgi:hypothetical protein
MQINNEKIKKKGINKKIKKKYEISFKKKNNKNIFIYANKIIIINVFNYVKIILF